MKTLRHFKSFVLVGLLLASLAQERASADVASRLEQGARRCSDQLIEAIPEALGFDAANRDALDRSLRCIDRFKVVKPRILAAKKSLQQRIAALTKKIKKKRAEAQNLILTNPLRSGQLFLEVNELNEKRKKLREKLEKQNGKKKKNSSNTQSNGGKKCSDEKSKVNFRFENNSSSSVEIFIDDDSLGPQRVGTNASGNIGTLTLTRAQAKELARSSGGKEIRFIFVARVNGQNVEYRRTAKVKRFPKQPPCRGTFTYEYFDNNFPAPPAEWFVFRVDAGPNIYIGKEDVLKERTPRSFLNGGLDSESKVTYTKASGPHATLDEAQIAFCDSISSRGTWPLFAPCQKWFKFETDKRFWGCESSVTAAVNKHCPN